MTGIYICTHCEKFKKCCSPAKLQEPSSLIDCPYENPLEETIDEDIY